MIDMILGTGKYDHFMYKWISFPSISTHAHHWSFNKQTNWQKCCKGEWSVEMKCLFQINRSQNMTTLQNKHT